MTVGRTVLAEKAESLPEDWMLAAARLEREARIHWRLLEDPAYMPARTERGRRLRELRRRVIESGEPLLDLDGILRLLGRNTG
ncbi:hypothetical protein HRbin39_00864 [bacterium HR39]|nr:hypothetical protein HRbin39_00864 [bacterium HR39]